MIVVLPTVIEIAGGSDCSRSTGFISRLYDDRYKTKKFENSKNNHSNNNRLLIE